MQRPNLPSAWPRHAAQWRYVVCATATNLAVPGALQGSCFRALENN
ncbi:MAG: hypothetical protein ACK5QX_09250 [bacterium]